MKELFEHRQKLVQDARDLNDKALKESRDFTGDERASFDKIFSDIKSVDENISHAKRMADLDRVNIAVSEVNERTAKPLQAEAGKAEARNTYLRDGQFTSDAESRALQADISAAGGFLLMPETFNAMLIKGLDDEIFMRQVANVLPSIPMSSSLGTPYRKTAADDHDWTAEIGTIQEEASLAFGKRVLKPQQLTKLIKVSLGLLSGSGLSAEAIVMSELIRSRSETQENAFLTGNGVAQPLGIYTASSNGVSTSRDVSTGNTTTAIKYDGLIRAAMSLKPGHRRSAIWNFHTDAVLQLMLIVDADGQYVWKEAQNVNSVPTLLSRPVYESAFTPNTFTTGLYVGAIFNPEHYWIVDGKEEGVQRLNELFALTSQVGYVSRSSCDGAPVLEEAFARVKLA